MTSKLSQFLNRNSVIPCDGLPLVHSTRSYELRAIMAGGGLDPQPCDVFKGQDLTYFFVGRPAYKYRTDTGTAEAWELPCCFIFESTAIKAKRIFPFDTGAFKRKRYPSYINAMPMKEFEIVAPDAVERVIGSFFASSEKYFDLKPKSRDDFKTEFSLTPFDAELFALVKLASEETPTTFDDRRFSIEVQTDERVDLKAAHPLAVVLPDVYLSMKEVRDKIQVDWGAEAIGYPTYPLSLDAYYALIYKEVRDFYDRKGFL